MSKYGTLKDNEGNKIYPNAYYKIGDIFITTNSENPSNRFGGTWERIKGKMLIGVDEDDTDFNASGKTGGEKEVTLTVEQIPAHSHSVNKGSNVNANGWNFIGGYGGDVPSDTKNNTDQTGGGQAHNNMPPFYTVYIWIRVA